MTALSDEFWRGYKMCLDFIRVEHRMIKQNDEVEEEFKEAALAIIEHLYEELKEHLPTKTEGE